MDVCRGSISAIRNPTKDIRFVDLDEARGETMSAMGRNDPWSVGDNYSP